jgi:hypothetical protein
MSSEMNKDVISMCFKLVAEESTCLKPLLVKIEKTEASENEQSAPLKYMADALVGLSLIKMNTYFRNPFNEHKFNYPFASEAWRALDPHFDIYNRSQERVHFLKKDMKPAHKASVQTFEQSFKEMLGFASLPDGFDLTSLWTFTDYVDSLEEQMNQPLLYNFALSLSHSTRESLHTLYSFLYHLRALVGMDYNAYATDVTHEAVKIDSITDYLPKAEYVVNDALLYLNYKKHCKSYMTDNHGTHFEKQFKAKMDADFRTFLHNGMALVENMPKGFAAKYNQDELTQALYMAQMDWLLGTDAGLLFKVREEIYGLKEGYDRIFWTDLPESHNSKKTDLRIQFKVTEKELFPEQSAA